MRERIGPQLSSVAGRARKLSMTFSVPAESSRLEIAPPTPAKRAGTLVSLLIPTRNRHALLAEALASVAAQSHAGHEVVIVDDASSPPVDAALIEASGVKRWRLLRNEESTGQARARELAELEAGGDFIVHLDDDDLLEPGFLARGLQAFDEQPGLGVVFFNVRGFGERAQAFDDNQHQALARVLRAAGRDGSAEFVSFDGTVFQALLRSVPLAFQRPMARREAWRVISSLRRAAYPQGHALRPPLRESEWAMYAAATQRVGLLTRSLYLQRCSGQGYFSVDSQKAAAERAILEIMESMGSLSERGGALGGWRDEIRTALARTHFDRAYGDFHLGKSGDARRHLWRAISLEPRFAYLRFAVRMLLPPRR